MSTSPHRTPSRASVVLAAVLLLLGVLWPSADTAGAAAVAPPTGAPAAGALTSSEPAGPASFVLTAPAAVVPATLTSPRPGHAPTGPAVLVSLALIAVAVGCAAGSGRRALGVDRSVLQLPSRAPPARVRRTG